MVTALAVPQENRFVHLSLGARLEGSHDEVSFVVSRLR